MKTAIIAMLLTAAVSPIANAEDNYPSNFYANCCAVGTVKFRDLSKETPTYQSQSQTVISSSYGTSVINGTYRSYSRPR